MGRSNDIAALAISFLLCGVAINVQHVESAGLVYDYYSSSCPRAETIIHDTVYKLYEKKGNIATSLIRFVFHDCFNVGNPPPGAAYSSLSLEAQLFSNHHLLWVLLMNLIDDSLLHKLQHVRKEGNRRIL